MPLNRCIRWRGQSRNQITDAIECEILRAFAEFPACRAVIAYLQRDSELRLYAYKSRN